MTKSKRSPRKNLRPPRAILEEVFAALEEAKASIPPDDVIDSLQAYRAHRAWKPGEPHQPTSRRRRIELVPPQYVESLARLDVAFRLLHVLNAGRLEANAAAQAPRAAGAKARGEAYDRYAARASEMYLGMPGRTFAHAGTVIAKKFMEEYEDLVRAAIKDGNRQPTRPPGADTIARHLGRAFPNRSKNAERRVRSDLVAALPRAARS